MRKNEQPGYKWSLWVDLHGTQQLCFDSSIAVYDHSINYSETAPGPAGPDGGWGSIYSTVSTASLAVLWSFYASGRYGGAGTRQCRLDEVIKQSRSYPKNF